MRGRIAIMVVLGMVVASGSADASWPLARHDAKRTGAAAGSSDITAPVAYWRTYLGGGLGAGQLLSADVNGDGVNDIVLVSGGAVVAKSVTDAVYWKTQTRGLEGITAIADLDGDGKQDIIAYSSDHTYVISAATGAIEWAEPDGEMGSVGSVRVGDVTGDGKPDIVVTECGCCGVNSGKSGFVWTFGSGFGAAQSVGQLQVFTCGTSASVTLGDADGQGGEEILLADYDHFALLKADGSVIAATPALGTRVAENNCVAVNLDGKPGDEFVCILNSGDAPATDQRKVTVLGYDAQNTALNVLWSQVLAPDAGGNLRWVDPVVDLDGDGQYELVISAFDPNNGWQTHIFDALTGNDFTPAMAPGQIIQGTAALENSTKRLALTSSGTDLVAWSFSRIGQPMVVQRWTIANQTLMSYTRPDAASAGAISRAAVALDLNGDGLEDIVTSGATQPSSLAAFSGAGGTPKQIGSYALPTGTDPQSVWVLPPITTSNKQVGLVTTDGVLSLLDATLQPTKDPNDASKQVAIRVGGYFASGAWREMWNAPRLYPLSGGKADAILVDDSRKSLLRFDGTTASWAIPPSATWAVSHTFAPTIVDKLDGNKPGAACLALKEPVTNPPAYRVRALRGDGSIMWDVATESTPLSDMATGDLNADGVPDFVLQWAAPSDVNIVTRAFSGANGATLWETAPLNPGAGGVQSPGISVGSFGNLSAAVFFQGGGTRVLDGATGTQVAIGGTPNEYSLPVLIDNGSGGNNVLLTSGYWPVSLYGSDLQTALWTSSDDDRPYPYPGVAQCGTTPTLVQGSWQNPARLKLTPLAGASLGNFKTVVLSGGKVYADEAAAKSAGGFLGQLTAANVHANLTGAGHPTAVVGSTDGWLYGINPCSGTLDFALEMGAAVGEAVFGDTDGDGRDEVIVTTADGFLYDIKNQAIAKPAFVWDTDPDHGITDHDVSTIETVDKLSGTWAAVPGATGYEVTVVTKDGSPVPTPVWTNVGTATSASLTGLSLTVGTEYFFAVHALSAKGPSVDTLSDGVTVIAGGSDAGADAAPDGGTVGGGGGGCGCEIVPSSSPLLGLAGVVAALAAMLARRRRRA